jgi:hypothetical protein
MEKSAYEKLISKPKNLMEKARRAILDEVVIVARVRSSSAIEAEVNDADLMQYYIDHPETDRDDLLVDSTVTKEI